MLCSHPDRGGRTAGARTNGSGTSVDFDAGTSTCRAGAAVGVGRAADVGIRASSRGSTGVETAVTPAAVGTVRVFIATAADGAGG
jgi:hypothetical protein